MVGGWGAAGRPATAAAGDRRQRAAEGSRWWAGRLGQRGGSESRRRGARRLRCPPPAARPTAGRRRGGARRRRTRRPGRKSRGAGGRPPAPPPPLPPPSPTPPYLDVLRHLHHPRRHLGRAPRLVLAKGAPRLVEEVEPEDGGVVLPRDAGKGVFAVEEGGEMVADHGADAVVGPEFVGFRHRETAPLDVRGEAVADVGGEPHVDGDEEDAHAAGAGDGVDVVEALENALIVLARRFLQHEARLLAVAEDAHDVEPGVARLVEDFGHIVFAEAFDGGAGGGVAGDGGGLAVEVDPGWGGWGRGGEGCVGGGRGVGVARGRSVGWAAGGGALPRPRRPIGRRDARGRARARGGGRAREAGRHISGLPRARPRRAHARNPAAVARRPGADEDAAPGWRAAKEEARPGRAPSNARGGARR